MGPTHPRGPGAVVFAKVVEEGEGEVEEVVGEVEEVRGEEEEVEGEDTFSCRGQGGG